MCVCKSQGDCPLVGSLNLRATGLLVFGEQEQLASEFVPDDGIGLILTRLK